MFSLTFYNQCLFDNFKRLNFLRRKHVYSNYVKKFSISSDLSQQHQILSLPSLPIFRQAVVHAKIKPKTHPAIIDTNKGASHSYSDLIRDTTIFRNTLLNASNSKGTFIKKDLGEARVAILCPSGYDYVVAQWATWAAGGVAVPLCISHPSAEILYTLKDSAAEILVTNSELYEKARDVARFSQIKSIIMRENPSTLEEFEDSSMFPMDLTRRAMIIYTSGTTGKPKGVVSTHSNIEAQVKSLVDRWRWSSNDKILHVLPLHHMHGILNALTCALYSGATVEMLPKFNPQDVWNRFMDQKRDLSLFMAVPTIYSKLVDYYQTKLTPSQQQDATRACSQFRVMISGSAALPVPLLNAWIDISGQVLLERYGLTEIGMALSGGYEIEKRITGCVGVPLPGVQIRLIAEDGTDVTNKIEEPGEIQVKGSNVFKEYWNRPEATMKEFTEDGWFKTGDIALRTPVHHQFKILGRKSVDIIKSGGYKISAIEVEHELGAHPDIMEVAVLGIDDQDWGQRVGAIIVPKDQNTNLDLAAIREFARQRLASYKIPTILKVYKNELPRNPMGKLNKKELENFF